MPHTLSLNSWIKLTWLHILFLGVINIQAYLDNPHGLSDVSRRVVELHRLLILEMIIITFIRSPSIRIRIGLIKDPDFSFFNIKTHLYIPIENWLKKNYIKCILLQQSNYFHICIYVTGNRTLSFISSLYTDINLPACLSLLNPERLNRFPNDPEQ